jgi:hypothetical protein
VDTVLWALSCTSSVCFFVLCQLELVFHLLETVTMTKGDQECLQGLSCKLSGSVTAAYTTLIDTLRQENTVSDAARLFTCRQLINPALNEIDQASTHLGKRRSALAKLLAHQTKGTFPEAVFRASVELQIPTTPLPGLAEITRLGQMRCAEAAKAKRQADLAVLVAVLEEEISILETTVNLSKLSERLKVQWAAKVARFHASLPDSVYMNFTRAIELAYPLLEKHARGLLEQTLLADYEEAAKAQAKAEAKEASTMDVDDVPAASSSTLRTTVAALVKEQIRALPPTLAAKINDSKSFKEKAKPQPDRVRGSSEVVPLIALTLISGEGQVQGRLAAEAVETPRSKKARGGRGTFPAFYQEGEEDFGGQERVLRPRTRRSRRNAHSRMQTDPDGAVRASIGADLYSNPVHGTFDAGSSSPSLSLCLAKNFDVRRSITYPDEFLLLNTQQQAQFIMTHSRLDWLETRLTNKVVQNPFSLVLPHEVMTVLAHNSKFIPRPKIDKDMVLAGWSRLERSVRLRIYFNDRGTREFNPRFHVGSSSAWQPTVEQRDVNAEMGLDLGRRVLISMLHKSRRIQPSSNISGKAMHVFREFLSQGTTVIRPSDKNLGLCVLPVTWYVSECLRQLGDETTYHRNEPNVAALINGLTDLVVGNRQHLTRQEQAFVLERSDPEEIRIPGFYILPKLHKVPMKGRPIVPSYAWVTTNLSVWLDFKLRPLLDLFPWILRDSKQLLRSLPTSLDSTYCDAWLLTADIASMYTNLDTLEGVKIIRHLWLELYGADMQDEANFIAQCLKFVLNNNFLSFQGIAYLQTKGAAMGSNCIPTYANLYAAAHERFLFLKELGADFANWKHYILYRRFLDDVLGLVTGSADEVAHLRHLLNNCIPGLTFEWAVSRQSVAFLDLYVELSRTSSALSKTVHVHTCVYQKPLNAYQYIPWQSDHPVNVKKAFIKGELLRYTRTSSSYAAYKAIELLFYERLRARGYPVCLLNAAFKQVNYLRDRASSLLDRERPDVRARAPLVFHGSYNPIWKTIRMDLVFNAMMSQWSYQTKQMVLASGQSSVVRAMHRPSSIGDRLNAANARAVRDAPDEGPQHIES